MQYSEFSLDDADVKVSIDANRGVQSSRNLSGPFVSPIPLAWIQVASRLRPRTLAVAIAIRFKHGLCRGAEFKLTNRLLEEFSVARSQKYRALEELEKAGLIELVQGGNGKNPVIRVREITGE